MTLNELIKHLKSLESSYGDYNVRINDFEVYNNTVQICVHKPERKSCINICPIEILWMDPECNEPIPWKEFIEFEEKVKG